MTSLFSSLVSKVGKSVRTVIRTILYLKYHYEVWIDEVSISYGGATVCTAPEIVRNICSRLSTRDILNLRTQNRVIATEGARYVFRNLHLMFHKKSHQKLLNISLDPILSTYVESIFYEYRLLKPVFLEQYHIAVWKYFRLTKSVLQEAVS